MEQTPTAETIPHCPACHGSGCTKCRSCDGTGEAQALAGFVASEAGGRPVFQPAWCAPTTPCRRCDGTGREFAARRIALVAVGVSLGISVAAVLWLAFGR